VFLHVSLIVGNVPTLHSGAAWVPPRAEDDLQRRYTLDTVTVPRDLGDGLVLRAATAADADALAAFNADVLRGQDMTEPQPNLGEWTRDLVTGAHPVARAGHATIVEDTKRGIIVSSMILLSHTWSYGGVRIPVGQPELVGTRTESRGRGLVRTQFELHHARSAARGHVMEAITGIPWFYRQFGYELAIGRGGGGRLFASELAALPDSAGFRVRAATEADDGFLAALDATASARYALWVPRDAGQWRYEIAGHREGSAVRHVICVIEDAAGRAIGMLVHGAHLWAETIPVIALEVVAGLSWRAAAVAAMHHLRTAGEALAARDGTRFDGANLWLLRRDHPLYAVLRVRYDETDTWYAVYTRVADVAAFLRAVVPALERRIAQSPVAGHSSELRLSFYRDGVRLVLEDGRVKTVERWQPPLTLIGQENGLGSRDPGRAHALFPDLTFLQLLFGLRSLEDLVAWYPDCVVRTAEARAILHALFPRQPSVVWPVV
jgi:hypothetical protein